MSTVIEIHENKAMPAPIPYTKIVEAYGLRRCPKLIEQVAGDDLDVRINALAVLCDDFNNPYNISGSAQVGAIKILAAMVTDPDYTTRDRSSKALAIAARDANGLASILEDGASTVSDILQGINDPAVEVRRNVYECLLQVSRTLAGVNTCVGAGVTAAFVNAIGREDDALKVLLLKTIYNIVGSNQGREDAVAADAVKICIGLLSRDEASSQSASATTANAARTLGFLCYDEEAKVKAIEGNAVSILFSFLSNSSVSGGGSIKTEVTMALMAITSTDEGKRQIMACNGVDTLVSLLNDDSRVLRLNSLKVIANAVVFPPIRARLLADHGCLVLLNRIKVDSSDSLLQRHAGIALAAVNWTP